MIQHFVKNKEGVYAFEGSCTYAALQNNWDVLIQDFFVGDKEIILDFKEVERVDSAFLAFLLAMLRKAHHQHTLLKIKSVTANIKSLMQVQGVWPLFKELIG
jgi:ABC-type transporter Mla MlaB component